MTTKLSRSWKIQACKTANGGRWSSLSFLFPCLLVHSVLVGKLPLSGFQGKNVYPKQSVDNSIGHIKQPGSHRCCELGYLPSLGTSFASSLAGPPSPLRDLVHPCGGGPATTEEARRLCSESPRSFDGETEYLCRYQGCLLDLLTLILNTLVDVMAVF